MLTKLEIKNYRGFPSYRMEGLARVNLLVGKNNSGKTALLEGTQFLVSGGDPNVLEAVGRRRGELVLSRPDRTPDVDVTHFFNGHQLSIDSYFEISGNNGFNPVKVRIIPRGKRENKDPASPPLRRSSVLLKIEGGKFAEGDERIFSLARDGSVDFERRPRRFGFSEIIEGSAVRFIGTDAMTTGTLASMWDEIQLNGLEDEVRDALRVLEPDLSSVRFLTGISTHGYYPSKAGVIVGLGNDKQRLPLGSMGDGMRRMLALATSLACTRDGALFADEIDTGLHYSIMADMWRLVVDRATALNAQVFATTHSWDCIEGLSALCQREPQWLDKIAIHTIDRMLPHSIAFRGDSVLGMAKHGTDPR